MSRAKKIVKSIQYATRGAGDPSHYHKVKKKYNKSHPQSKTLRGLAAANAKARRRGYQ